MKHILKDAALMLALTGTFVFIGSQSLLVEDVQAAKTLAGTKPNIVVILTDDQTFESVSKMPYLSTRKDWITFTKAFDNVAVCCAARATILTGQYDTHTGVLNNAGKDSGTQLDESETLAKWLDNKGYRTALIGKYLNNYPWDRGNYVPKGWDKWFVFSEPPGPLYYGYTINDGTAHTRFNVSI